MMGILDCVGWIACEMEVIAVAVRIGIVRIHEVLPLDRFREAVLMALPDDEAREKLPELPERGNFKVRQVLKSGYFFC
jgi:hypothetical protein